MDPFRELVPAISQAALDEGQSRELIVGLAGDYDRGSEQSAGDDLEKSSFSGGGGSDCVEVTFVQVGVGVRDSKNASGPTLRFGPEAWRAFLPR